MTISREALSKVPYLDVAQLGERVVPLHPLFADGKWRHWLPVGADLVEASIADHVKGQYYSNAPARDDDLYVVFLDLLMRVASFDDVVRRLFAMEDDLQNLATTLAKLSWYSTTPALKESAPDFAVTDYEYVLMVCRSLLDLIQEVAARLWKRTLLTAPDAHKRELKDSFGKMVLAGNEPATSAALQERYGLPAALGDFYEAAAPFALKLRTARDAIVHRGGRAPIIYAVDAGLAVGVDEPRVRALADWSEDQLLRNALGSLNFLLSSIINETLRVGERFVEALVGWLAVPPALAPNHRVYLRGPHLAALKRSLEIIPEHPWEPFGGALGHAPPEAG